MNHLMSLLNHGVSLRVASGDELTDASVLVVKHGLHFFREFFSSVHDHLGRPWVASEPNKFQLVGHFVCTLVSDLDDFEPSRCGIDHGEAMERDSVLAFPYLVGTNEVNT